MASAPNIKKIGKYEINTEIDDALGQTNKCVVFKGKHADSPDEVAAKMFTWTKGYSTEEVDREAQLMKDLPPHDNVLKLFDYIKKDVGPKQIQLWLILEFCKSGHLGQFTEQNTLNLPQKIDLFLQSAKGVKHIHEQKMVHRDIKPQNLLVHGSEDSPVVKVADMGISRSMEHLMTQMTPIGTKSYMPPEFFKGDDRPDATQAIDTFSLGMTFLDLLDLQEGSTITPFKVDDVPLGKYLHHHPATDVAALITKPSDSAEVRQIKETLIAAMLAPSAADRPSMQRVVNQLSELRTSLGVKVLLAVDTVWKKPVFYVNEECLGHVKASRSEQSPVPSSAASTVTLTQPAPLYDGGQLTLHQLDMPQDVLDGLTRLHVGGDTEDRLLVVDVYRGNRGVWMNEGTEWERVSDVPDECPMFGVCMCRVSDGFIVCGGRHGIIEPPVSQCHHFSVLTRQWRKLRDMPTPREFASAVEYDDMKILVAGGRDSDYKAIAVCEILDYRNNKLSPATNMPKPLEKPLIATEAGRVFILPRDDNLKQPALLAYDPSAPIQKGIVARLTSTTGKHTYKSKLPKDVHSTRGACLVSAANKLYLMGGEQGLALEYNPWADQWQNLTPPSLGYYRCCATVTPGLIRLYGGSTEGGRERNMVEVYDTHTRKWETLDMRLPFGYDYSNKLVAQFSV